MGAPDSVNPNYLGKVMDLAEDMDVKTTEDIYDAHGTKLIAKGTQISPALQEKLILHRLRKPLESSIAVEGGIDSKQLVAEAKRMAEEVAPLACILKTSADDRVSPFKIISGIQLGSAMTMLLTIIQRGGAAALSHNVMVSLLSIWLADRIGLGIKDQTEVALAGLLHDVGELYIDANYVHPGKRLRPHEWRHMVVHPYIGQMLIRDLEKCPPSVGRAVAEHHERLNGTGYPRQLKGNEISIGGQILSVSETMAGIFVRNDRPLERAELALKLVHGEHAEALVSAVSSAMQVSRRQATATPAKTTKAAMAADQATPAAADTPAIPAEAPTEVPVAPPADTSVPVADSIDSKVAEDSLERVRRLFTRITTVLHDGTALFESGTIASPTGNQWLLQALVRIHAVERAFVSTGIESSSIEDMRENPNIPFELDVAATEIQWRLRDVARDLALNLPSLEPVEADLLLPLVTLLDEEL